MRSTNPDKPHASKKGLIIGAIIAVFVIAVGLFMLKGVMIQPTMTQAEREQAMAELAEWAKDKKQSDLQSAHTGAEDIYQFIADYEKISGHKLDYDHDLWRSTTTIYDGICRIDVVNYNTMSRGNFQVTVKFDDINRDEHYKSAIQTILQVFGMEKNDIHKLTDHFISDNSSRYTFDTAFVDRNYHDSMRVTFQSTEKKKTDPPCGGTARSRSLPIIILTGIIQIQENEACACDSFRAFQLRRRKKQYREDICDETFRNSPADSDAHIGVCIGGAVCAG